ncbi:MAG: signal peptidase II [Actinomycetota bacterium]|nr:signal peptidase II [Actinomycetota bacterium]
MVLVVLVVDQLTTTWAVDRLSKGPIHLVWTLDLELFYNTGSAFSLFQGEAPVIAVVAAALVAAVAYAISRARSDALAASLGMVAGGALGNLADRLFRGHEGAVVDFIALHWWPTFNLADASIVVGGILSAVLIVRAGGAGGAGGSRRTS